MTTHNIRIVPSSPGRYFVADEDGEAIAESQWPLNAAAHELLRRHLRPRDRCLDCLHVRPNDRSR